MSSYEMLARRGGRRRLTSASAIAGPLEPGAQVGLQLPQAGTCAAQVASCDGRTLILELLDELPPGALRRRFCRRPVHVPVVGHVQVALHR